MKMENIYINIKPSYNQVVSKSVSI